MRAAVVPAYGPPEVVRIVSLPSPEPGPGEVRIRIEATTVSAGDARVRGLRVPRGYGPFARAALGWSGPRQPILGTELAGTVDALGPGVSGWSPGDPVVAFLGGKFGCHAELRVVAASSLVRRPPALGAEAAASLLFGGTTALDFLRRGRLVAGESLLVNGASGAVGVAAVQLGRHLGARVTAVASAGNAELVRSLGATHVVDHRTEDFTGGEARYDVILDAAGTAPFPRARRVLAEGGRLLQVLSTLGETILGPLQALGTSRRVLGGVAGDSPELVRDLVALAAAGTLRPVIHRTVPLDDIVEAHRLVDGGHKRGSVVVTPGG